MTRIWRLQQAVAGQDRGRFIRSHRLDCGSDGVAPAISDRHATAEQMRRDWDRGLEAQPRVPATADDELEASPIADAVIAAATRRRCTRASARTPASRTWRPRACR